ncbi:MULTISPECIES: hypothetical protein [Halomonadaceae]|jgi:hypothetical protein|uniref:hypothetical protein n=1 Tax=Halomonadaceae TaxID=28256 RepID=UPI000C34EA6E|nr:hypothetical protein [Halomonas sp. MES3-P3E]PKG54471.1 hypothetical protein CXF87_02650 [Halomonas sp. MES3-P3E]|tara:strand:+ start:6010 stop:6633 length:624 start_codon:yes stop_codon:yes gene_type:complete
MKELGWKYDNPFMPDLKTADDAREFIKAGGLGAIEARIERAFAVRFSDLKEKILRLSDHEIDDVLVANALLTSILVDTRALFLESDRHKRNATLQNVYRARRMDERARAVDAVFDEKVLDGMSLRTVIKSWVDQRIVHMDYLWDDNEVILFQRMETIIFGGRVNNLLLVLLNLIAEYEEVVSMFGENAQEQLFRVMRAITGDVEEDN